MEVHFLQGWCLVRNGTTEIQLDVPDLFLTLPFQCEPLANLNQTGCLINCSSFLLYPNIKPYSSFWGLSTLADKQGTTNNITQSAPARGHWD